MHKQRFHWRGTWCALALALVFVALGALSARPVAADVPTLALYLDVNYGGQGLAFNQSIPDLSSQFPGFNRQASSITMTNGPFFAAVYTGANYTGDCMTVTENVSYLGNTSIGNDTIASVKLDATCSGPAISSYLIDVRVVSSDNQSVLCPAGFTKKMQDLNEHAGGKFVYACVQYAQNYARAIGELYNVVGGRSDLVSCNGDDQRVSGDLNEGVHTGIFGDEVHEFIQFCVHRPGTNGGSGRTPNPGSGSNTYSPAPTNKALRDLSFIQLSDNAATYAHCVVHCVEDGIGTLAYLEYGANIDYFCQNTLSAGWHPLYSPWETAGAADAAKDVPLSSGVIDFNAGTFDSPFIFGCLSYGSPDTIKPRATVRATTATDGQPYAAGVWTNQSVVLTYTCVEIGANQSGIATNTLRPITISGEGVFPTTGTPGTCVDGAGNVADPVTFGPIMIDKTLPALSAHAVTADHQPYTPGTWTQQDVTVTFDCADAGTVQSDITKFFVPFTTINTEGNTSVMHGGTLTSDGVCLDGARNYAPKLTFGPVLIDRTAPTLTATAVTRDGNAYSGALTANQDVTITFACADAASGIASITTVGAGTMGNTTANSLAVTVIANGALTVQGTCTDRAGVRQTLNFPVHIDRGNPGLAASGVVLAGNNQTAGTDGTFATQLQAQMHDVNGLVVGANQSITIACNPSSGGACALFANDSSALPKPITNTVYMVSLQTDTNGVVTMLPLKSNGVAGTYTLTYLTNAGVFATFTLTNPVPGAAPVTRALRAANVGPQGVGVPFSVTISATDDAGTLTPGYTGTVHFTSSDPHASLPADYTFTAGDMGKHAFTLTLPGVGDQTIIVTDTSVPTITRRFTVTVSTPSGNAGSKPVVIGGMSTPVAVPDRKADASPTGTPAGTPDAQPAKH